VSAVVGAVVGAVVRVLFELARVTGTLFAGRKEIPPWGGPGDPAENERLWALSEQLTGVMHSGHRR
jgi:hypothetical protein